MVEIPDAWWLVLNALLEGPVAWQSPAEVATALDRDAEETTDLICLMHVAGWIDVWECEAGPLVTFSPLAAARLQVHLVEVGVEESPRWARVGDPPPPLPRARNVCKAELAAALDYVIDPAPEPGLAAERAEDVPRPTSTRHDHRIGHARINDLPRPTLLIGQGLTPWPGPGEDVRTDCPACGNLGLQPHMYCLCCDRWGRDGLVAPADAKKVSEAQRGRRSQPSPKEQARLEQLQYERERGTPQGQAPCPPSGAGRGGPTPEENQAGPEPREVEAAVDSGRSSLSPSFELL